MKEKIRIEKGKLKVTRTQEAEFTKEKLLEDKAKIEEQIQKTMKKYIKPMQDALDKVNSWIKKFS